jgi:cysteine desulfuration protein SufE
MPSKLDELVTELGEADRQERIELLIDLARDLPPLPDRLAAFKDEAHRVPECQSPVFLFVEPAEEGRVRLFADAPVEAPTVRGFVALLVAGLDGEPAAAVGSVPDEILQRSGLREILGMQRSAGLHGVLRRLRSMAARASAPPPSDPPAEAPMAPDHDALIAALRTVTDPELHVNVVDLGLVYGIQTQGDQVHVEMTLTSPACPAGPQIMRDAATALEKLDGVAKAHIKLVMNPPWSPDKMTDAARDELGIF